MVRFSSLAEAFALLRVHANAERDRDREISLRDFAKLTTGDGRRIGVSERQWGIFAGFAPEGDARPNASVCVDAMLEVMRRCWPDAVASTDAHAQEAAWKTMAEHLRALVARRDAPVAALSRASVVDRLTSFQATRNLTNSQLEHQLREQFESEALTPYRAKVKLPTGFVNRVRLQDERTAIQPDSAIYFLFLRAFAALSGDDLSLLQRLPRLAPGLEVSYALELHLSVETPSSHNRDAWGRSLVELARRIFDRLRSGRYGQLELPRELSLSRGPTAGSRIVIPIGLQGQLEVPEARSWADPLMFAFSLARQMRIAWTSSKCTVERLQRGLPPSALCACILTRTLDRSDGLPIEEGLAESPDAGLAVASRAAMGISLSGRAHALARAVDLRAVFGRPEEPGRVGTERGVVWYPVESMISFLYFDRIAELHSALDLDADRNVFADYYRSNPTDIGLGVELGTALLQQGLPRDCIRVVEQVLAVAPGNAVAWQLIAAAHANLGRIDAARPPSPEDWLASLRHYARGLAAARRAADLAQDNEDTHGAVGGLHLQRALDGFRFWDESLTATLAGAPAAAIQAVREAGYEPAAAAEPVDVRQQLQAACLRDLIQARGAFDRGLDASSTKARSIFWRLAVDAILHRYFANEAPTALEPGQLLGLMFAEVGWAGDSASHPKLLERAIGVYDAGVLTDICRPDARLAYAVTTWDYQPRTAETRSLALGYVDKALSALENLKANLEGRLSVIVRCWAHLQAIDEFSTTALAMRKELEAWDGSAAPELLLRHYLGAAISRCGPWCTHGQDQEPT